MVWKCGVPVRLRDGAIAAAFIVGGLHGAAAQTPVSVSPGVTTEITSVVTDADVPGGLEKTGGGTLILSGANTYSGGTTATAGTLTANHINAFNLFDALGTGDVTLNGGTLRSAITGSLANNLTFFNGTTSTLSAAAGTVLTLGGDPNTTGNQNTAFNLNANATAIFGSTTDTGTIRINASSAVPSVDGTSAVVVAGGTLQDFQSSLWQVLSSAGSTTINSGATIDFNDAAVQVIVNLNGATGSRIMTGTTTITPATLSIYNTVGGTQTFGGVISGTHPVEFVGGGTMILTGDNTYTGGTQICFCMTLQLGNGGTTGSVVGDIINENRLIFNRSNTYMFTGVISDAGDVIQNGTGNLILTATSTYTGNTRVNAGTLSVNGDITSSNRVTVNSGGTLGGTGIVPRTTINAGGTLAPGNSIGTITVQGNLGFASAAFYRVEFSATAADRTNVVGVATLGGATVQAVPIGSSFTRQTYTILNATGGISGTFGALTLSGSAFVNASLGYDANNVYLTIAPSRLSVPSDANSNQTAVINAINASLDAGLTPPAGFDALLNLNGSQLLGALSQLSGEPGADVAQSGFAAMTQFLNALWDAAFNDSGGQGGVTSFTESAYAPKPRMSPDVAAAYAAVMPRDGMPAANRWNLWATGYGGNITVSGDAATGARATTNRAYGLMAGADYRLGPDTRVGFAMGGAGTSFSLDGGAGSGKADLFNAALYGKHNWGSTYIAGALAYAWQDTTTDRTVSVSGTDNLHAGFRAQALSLRGELGRRYAMPMFGATPYAALQTTTFYLPAYSESATSGSNQFALSYASQTVTATRAELGARFDKVVLVRDGVLTLKAKTAWAHDWNNNRAATATFQQLPGTSFVVNGAQPSADAALVSLGAEMGWRNGWTLAANFDGEFSRATRGYAGKGSVRYVW